MAEDGPGSTALLPHLFRTEYSRIVAVLARQFGLDRLGDAEDIASETFVTATQVWGLQGIPDNPVAWLYRVAKNKALNHLRRRQVFRDKVRPALEGGAEAFPEIDLTPDHIRDSQLAMMFAVCHPAIPAEAQAGLALRILCGFGIGEIADAFLTGKDTVNKRLFRAREKLRQERVSLALPAGEELPRRLPPVLTTLYLLFNEGYYSFSHPEVLRKNLCMEAMRLTRLLLDNERTALPEVNALLALMCFHASRFGARIDKEGSPVLYGDQDSGAWDTVLVSQGGYFLQRAAAGDQLSRYHLEAGVAYWHTRPEGTPEKWESILRYYDGLLERFPSPVAALNRIYALSRVQGRQAALRELAPMELPGNRFYHLLLAELYRDDKPAAARRHLIRARDMAPSPGERRIIQKKLDSM